MSESQLVTFEDFKTGLVELIERMNVGDDCGELFHRENILFEQFYSYTLLGDQSGCYLGVIDIKTKVAFNIRNIYT